MSTEQVIQVYPADLQIDYPETTNRLTTFFRPFVALPILIIFNIVSYAVSNLSLAILLMILFRKKYPRWWFDWNLAFTRFSLRIAGYMLLLQHDYPSTDEDQAVHVKLIYPDVEKELGRGMPLIKWLLAVPHFFILLFLYLAVFVVSIIAWFAILFTGKYPRGMFDFTVGVMRWNLRVQSYFMLLITDQYPPFSMQS